MRHRKKRLSMCVNLVASPRLRRAGCAALLLAGWLATPITLVADDAPRDRAGEEFFERSVRPLLVAHCYECHSTAGIQRTGRKTPGGNFLLDTRAGLRAGGDLGPAVVPGKPEESQLVA